jgi:hypothetical protein
MQSRKVRSNQTTSKLRQVLQKPAARLYIISIETVGGTSVSSDSWGEDGCHELAGAVHFHVASPAQH